MHVKILKEKGPNTPADRQNTSGTFWCAVACLMCRLVKMCSGIAGLNVILTNIAFLVTFCKHLGISGIILI